ncbi:lysozyme inhibitor LprI family protein [Bacillus sp. JJ1521]|uniref:lysozyme inhibitor LprI family protein n=1 Tax=Bacillus sp. JJ1521 TaxID=3122957 RepID=UPI002FFD6C77
MKKLLLLTGLLVLLAACGNTDEEASSPSEEPVKSVENESDSEKADQNDAIDVSKESDEANATDENVDANASDTNGNATAENSELKNQYLNELEAIEKEIEIMPAGETQIEMEEIAAETYKIWDDQLNKIWKEIEKQLPAEKMDKLREEQRRWIKFKYETASKEAAKYEGGTMEPLVKISKQAEVTKERCYELVEKYM